MNTKKFILLSLITASISIFSIETTQSSKPTIIILHGCSSSGKTSVAKELQSIYAADHKPFIYLPLDTFLSMLPINWINLTPHGQKCNDLDGLQFITTQKDSESAPITNIVIGQTIINALRGIIHSIDAFAQCNNNVIFEGAFPVLFFDDIKLLKRTYTIYIVNVTCDLAIMEDREIKRDGIKGLTRGQYLDPEYHYSNYDFSVDTSNISSHDAAQQIKTWIATIQS